MNIFKSMTRRMYLLGALCALMLAALPVTSNAADLDHENLLVLELKDGVVLIQMFPELAPNHVARIKELVREGYYDGLTWHRVIDGFMAQTGDPTGTGAGGTNIEMDAEFSDVPFVRGIVGMARKGDPNSADSQWFIMFDRSAGLDGKYTVWGRVVRGMEFVDMIKKGDPRQNGTVMNPDKIISLQVYADMPE